MAINLNRGALPGTRQDIRTLIPRYGEQVAAFPPRPQQQRLYHKRDF